jgi:hypothetical protein
MLMKTLRFKVVLLVLVLAGVRAKACDICGCGAALSAGGLFPQVQTNMLGIRQTAQRFIHPKGNFNGLSEVYQDHYDESDVFFRWFPKSRLQLWFHLPYRVVNRVESERITTVRGIGDMQLRALYTVIKPDTGIKRFKQVLQVGGGLSLPTGKYRQRDEQLTLLPIGIQAGTGAWSGMLNAVYLVQSRKAGLALQADVRTFSTNEDLFKRGHTAGASAQLFLRRNWFRNVLALPHIGARYDVSGADRQFDLERPDSGSSGGQTSIGLDCFGKGWMAGCQVSYFLPRNQAVVMPQPEPGFQLSFGFIW